MSPLPRNEANLQQNYKKVRELMSLFSTIQDICRRVFTSFPAANPKDTYLLIRKKIYLVLGFAFFWSFGIQVIDPAPPLSDADVYEGQLLVAAMGDRSSLIKIQMPKEEVRFRSFQRDELFDELNQHIGSHVKVWAYDRPGAFLFSERILIELEIAGSRLINNWDEVRARTQSNSALFFSVAGITLMFFSILSIMSITHNKEHE